MWIINGATSVFQQSVGATGDNAATLAARGPNDVPVPEKCCAICNDEPFNGVQYNVYMDVMQTQRLDTCALFTLEYYDDGTTVNPWHCYFFANTAVTMSAPSTGVLSRYTFGGVPF